MEIWVHRNGQYAGRFSEAALREKIADGSLSPTDLAWDEAKSAWQPLSEFLASAAASSGARAGDILPSTAKESTPPTESKTPEARPSGPPPLPSVTAPVTPMPIPASGPPPLPSPVFSPAVAAAPAQAAAGTQPPEGERIWNPYIAILGSIFLSPAFGGFFIWRNWLRMNRRRRAMVAAPWFWIGFVLIGLLFYSRDKIVWVIWAAYLVAWIAFSAYPQIRYVHTTFKRERLMSSLPLVAALFLSLFGGVVYWLTKPDTTTIPTLAPGPVVQQSPIVAPVVSQTDHVYSAEELRDMYKSSVLEVRATWKERKALNLKKDNGANGTGVLIYNDAEYGLVATNWHVVDPGDNMSGDYKCGVRFAHDKEFADVEVVARAKNDVDLALLLVRLEGKWTPNQFPVRMLDNIKEGECCIAIGNALGEGLSITSGIVSRFDKVKDQTLIRTSTPVSPGNSGGPLILCKGGSLGGIVTLQSRITNVQNVNFATPAQYLFDKDNWEWDGGQDKAQQLLDTAIAQAQKH